jgi:hypothetical protein
MAMKMLGVVKYVYYSEDDGTITKGDVATMECAHFSRGQRMYHKLLDDQVEHSCRDHHHDCK